MCRTGMLSGLMREPRASVSGLAAGCRSTRPRGVPNTSTPLDQNGLLQLPSHLRRAVCSDGFYRQPIANPANGMQIARLRRIRLQFLSQILHPRLHQASEIRVKPLVQVFREIAITAHQELSF